MTLRYPFVTFLSDYGLTDEFVGVCKGVILRIAPEVRIIDLSHDIKAQSVREGALVLAQAVGYMPPAVHLGVVDPGVGSTRRGVAIETASDRWLVGPDNGLLIPAASRLGGIASVRELRNPDLMLAEPSRTFHGRDVFAPAAAHLAIGIDPESFGPEIPAERLEPLALPLPRRHESHYHAVILHVDRFGNLQLNVRPEDLDGVGLQPGALLEVRIEGNRAVVRYGETFSSVPEGELVVNRDSHGLLTLAVNQGSAAYRLGVTAGSRVIVGAPGSAH
ncbi:MAG: SAM hydrolase/SAM-dependent halogenase family protein [Actinomycetota bacterium]